MGPLRRIGLFECTVRVGAKYASLREDKKESEGENQKEKGEEKRIVLPVFRDRIAGISGLDAVVH